MKWREHSIGELMLGTAQLSNAYGIANKYGAPTKNESLEIVTAAWQGGINAFDTAQNYGESEDVLGECLKQIGANSKALIITKISRNDFDDVNSTTQSIKKSQEKLGVETIFGVLSHHPKVEDISEEKYREVFSVLKEKKLIQFAGISVYSGADALKAISSDCFDIIQMPLNVLDRSAIDLDIFSHAQKNDKLLVFRSVFLQGLLIMNSKELPPKMNFASDLLDDWNLFCKNNRLTPAEAALQIALQLSNGYPVIVGAESASQVKSNLKAAKYSLNDVVEESKKLLQKSTARICNPSLW